MLNNLANYCWNHLKSVLATLQMRWISVRRRRVVGVDLYSLLEKAHAAQQAAYARALFVDPADNRAAESAGHQAFRAAVASDKAKKRRGEVGGVR